MDSTEQPAGNRGWKTDLRNRWSVGSIVVFGIGMGTFGIIVVVLSFVAELTLDGAISSCLGIPACVGQSGSTSTLSQLRQAWLTASIASAVGVGPIVGGFVLAFNAWRQRK